MMWVMFDSVLSSLISLFSVLNQYYRQSHIQHLSLVGLPTAYFDKVGKPLLLVLSSTLHCPYSLFSSSGSSLPVSFLCYLRFPTM